MTIHSSIKAMILEDHSEASKNTSTPTEMLKGLDKQLKRKEDGGLYLAERIWVLVYGNLRTLIMNEAHAMSYFTSRFWKSLQKALGTRLDLSVTYHPETDRQSERTIQTLEDMLRACAMDFGRNWDTHLPLVEFSYNNSYYSSIKRAPFEALYEIVQETTDKIFQIKERLKVARDRQKSYVDKRRKPLEFSVGDKVLLKVSPRKGVVRFEIPGLHQFACTARRIKVDDKLQFVEEPIEILDREVKKLKRRWIPIVKVSLELPTRTRIYLGTRRRDEAQVSAFVRKHYSRTSN
nr:hypothetical protein [Tanacetum cinerariifolium]